MSYDEYKSDYSIKLQKSEPRSIRIPTHVACAQRTNSPSALCEVLTSSTRVPNMRRAKATLEINEFTFFSRI